MRAFIRRPHLMVAIGLILIPLSGCGLGDNKASFVTVANKACQRSAINLSVLENGSTDVEKLAHVIDVYAERDKLVSELREMSLPSSDADTLQSRWLQPAQKDLAQIYDRLPNIRNHDQAPDLDQVSAEETALDHLGGAAVDNAFLASYGLTECQQLFGER